MITNFVTLSALRSFYQVEKTDNPRMPYRLTGKRGAVYGLMCQAGPDGAPRPANRYPMFAVNSRNGAIVRVARYQTEWVKDDEGTY